MEHAMDQFVTKALAGFGCVQLQSLWNKEFVEATSCRFLAVANNPLLSFQFRSPKVCEHNKSSSYVARLERDWIEID